MLFMSLAVPSSRLVRFLKLIKWVLSVNSANYCEPNVTRSLCGEREALFRQLGITKGEIDRNNRYSVAQPLDESEPSVSGVWVPTVLIASVTYYSMFGKYK